MFIKNNFIWLKVYEDLSDKLDDTGVNDLKTSCLASSLSIDLNGSPPSSAGVAPAGSQVFSSTL